MKGKYDDGRRENESKMKERELVGFRSGYRKRIGKRKDIKDQKDGGEKGGKMEIESE